MYSSRQLLLLLACMLSLLTAVEMFRDFTSPFRDPCSGSATQAHLGDIAYVNVPAPSRGKRGATAIRELLWPGARVPYELSPSYTTQQRNVIFTAMRKWEERTCIRFYERPSDHNESYIYLFKGGCCASYVGRKTADRQQGVSLASACLEVPTILHELGHVIGFWHEQSRPDRDEYINVLTENVANSRLSNFRVIGEDAIDSLGVGYDYNSIMHYNHDAFGIDGRTTLQAHDPTIPIGKAVELSDLDVLQANLLYQCDTENLPPIEHPLVLSESTTPPPLPACGEDFINKYHGNFSSPNYPTYSHNQHCVYRITVPEGTILNVSLIDLDIGWSHDCEEDGLTIYRTVDGTGEPQRYRTCGSHSGGIITVTMESTVAYIEYTTDGNNKYRGRRGFYASFMAEDIDECLVGNGGCSQHCQNSVPGYMCYCDPGFFLSADSHTCFDVNECALRNGGCQYKCRNSGGSFTCECPEGSVLNADGKTCSNPEASCDVDNGGCDHVCSEGTSGVSCHCRGGYRLLTDGATCRDIDECVEGNTCSYGGCINTPGNYTCVCHIGYEEGPDPNTCINVDECSTGIDRCEGDSECLDTDGSYECTCPQGLRLSDNGRNCIDVDECQDSSTCPHRCVNTYGSYRCLCPIGYHTNATDADNCIDIDECLEGGCSSVEGATCVNTEGSFECQCNTGYRLTDDGQQCEDIDECSDGLDNCEHGCSNTNGSFVCTCNAGYMLEENGHSCKCGGIFHETSGRFSTPGWPTSYPQENFQCEWMIDLPHPEATIEFTIDDTAYGINGRAPCPTDYIMFLDGMDENAPSLHKLCKFDRPAPFTSSGSQARVVFAGTVKRQRPRSRVGVQVMYNMMMPATTASPSTSTTNPSTETPSAPVTDTTTSTTETPSASVADTTTSTTSPTEPPSTAVTDTATSATPTTETQPPTVTLPPLTTEAPVDTLPPVNTETPTLPPVDTLPPVNTDTQPPVTTVESHPLVETTVPIETQRPGNTIPLITTEPVVTVDLPLSIDECAVNNGGCEHQCVDTPESYYCECDSGYELSDNEHTCDFVCGGTFTDRIGNFQTPGWPNGYPQKDFVCEWRISRPIGRLIWFTINSDFGIDGEAPCTTDYLQFFSGTDQTSPASDKLCSAEATSSAFVRDKEAVIIFRGTKNSSRPADRVGVRVDYMVL